MSLRRPSTRVLLSCAAVMVVVASATIARQVGATRAAATANGSITVGAVSDLAGTWTAVNDVRAPSPVVSGSVVSLTFTGTTVRVLTGCNTLTGTVRVVAGTVVVEGLGGTEIGCEPALRRQEQWVGQMLRARPRLELSGPTLSLLWDEHWLGLSAQPDGGESATT